MLETKKGLKKMKLSRVPEPILVHVNTINHPSSKFQRSRYRLSLLLLASSTLLIFGMTLLGWDGGTVVWGIQYTPLFQKSNECLKTQALQ